MQTSKTAVVIFNLGGPDNVQAIQPFLFNLFNDPFIFGLPAFIRTPLAWLISTTRAPKVQPQYELMGGASPIQKNTLAQAAALQKLLPENFKVFTAQRYWHPMAEEVAAQVKSWGAKRVMLLPLYPQYSTTTTKSFEWAWEKAAKHCRLNVPTETICCYPEASGYVTAQADYIRPVLAEARKHGTPRVLFSAHGLPQKIVTDRGDPYPIHVQRSAAAIAAQLNEPDLDWLVSFQSRVGPLEWIKPYTIDEIRRAAREKVPLVIVPLAFVSEHLETLVELDHDYRRIADDEKIPFYGRVPTVFLHPAFIMQLHDLVLGTTPPRCHACPCSVKA